MKIPKYHETFIPILSVLGDGKIIHTNELKKKVCENFYADLPKELLEQKTKTGDILILNRIAWGKTYLKQAGMIQQPDRAMVQITEKGREVLKRGKLTLKELLHDEEFLAKRLESKKIKETDSINENASPQDMIDAGLQEIETQIKDELLNKLKNADPYYFEKIVLLLLQKMGYGDFKETAKSGDGGIDGIINQDALGLEKIFVQVKRYAENQVREPNIRNFIGAMSRGTDKGIFVTTSSFHESAIKRAHDAEQKIILIDGNSLVDLMYKYGVGVQVKDTYDIKQIDEDFFEE